MLRKLAAGGLAVLGVVAFGVGGTYAGFSSTKQAPSAVAQAGTLHLTLSTDQNGVIQPILFQNLVPGDAKSYYVKLTNTGMVAGTTSWAFDNVEERENGCGAVEVAAGDSSCGRGPNQGELGNQLAVTFSLLSNPDCTGTVDVVGPPSFPSSFSQAMFRDLNGLVLESGASRCVRVDIRFLDLPTNNKAQSDSSKFGFRFQLAS